jgi:hypothetical protein
MFFFIVCLLCFFLLFECSNENPPIKSKAGSGGRRFGIFPFDNAIVTTDTALAEKTKLELPMFLIRTALTYLDAVKKYGAAGLWDNRNTLPEMLHKAKEGSFCVCVCVCVFDVTTITTTTIEYLVESSPTVAFFASEFIEYDRSYQVDVLDLQKAYRQYVNDRSSSKKPKTSANLTRASSSSFLSSRKAVWAVDAKGISRYTKEPLEYVKARLELIPDFPGIVLGLRLRHGGGGGALPQASGVRDVEEEEIDMEDDEERCFGIGENGLPE